MKDGILPLIRMMRHSICEDCGYRTKLKDFYGTSESRINRLQSMWDSMSPVERERTFALDRSPRDTYEGYTCTAPKCENTRRNLNRVSILECSSFFPSSLGKPKGERGYSSCAAFIEGELKGKAKKPERVHRGDR